jgi:hypothetical protein
MTIPPTEYRTTTSVPHLASPQPEPILPMVLTPGRNQNILHAHKDRALNAGVITPCDLDTRNDPDPPCGTQHGGATYYHLKPGKTWDDYNQAVHP